MSAARRSVALAVVVVLATIGVAGAQGKEGRVTELVQLLSNKPDGMDEIAWKEKRRDAARELGDLGDTRAVPALIKVVETEEFDVVGEYAIVALGKLGDDRAINILRRVAANPARDRDQRKEARKALRRLGASAEGGGQASGGGGAGGAATTGTGGTSSGVTTGDPVAGGSDLIASSGGPAESGDVPEFDDDTLAAGEIIRFAVGDLSLQYDSVRNRSTLNGDVRGSYERRVDKKRVAWRYGGDAEGTFGFANFEGDNTSSRTGRFGVTVSGEGRAYLENAPLYAGGLAAAGSNLSSQRIFRDDDDNDYQLLFNAELQGGVFAGYGRVLDLGEAIRLRRIEKLLRETKTLGRPITPDLAAKILAEWWALRAELGAHRRLVVTVRLLREAGVLLGEPNASLSYKILQILLDGQLTHRVSGFDANVGIVESYLIRDDDLPVGDGRAETAIGRARFGKQGAEGEREYVGTAFARYRLFAPDGDPTPWAAGVRGDLRAFFYGPNWDPIGAIEIGVELGAANDDIGDSTTGTRVLGSAGWRWVFNRASSIRVAGEARLEAGELFFGLTLDGNYGFLDAGYVGASSMPATTE